MAQTPELLHQQRQALALRFLDAELLRCHRGSPEVRARLLRCRALALADSPPGRGLALNCPLAGAALHAYAAEVDNFQAGRQGLNNYADAAMSLAAGCQNRAADWQSAVGAAALDAFLAPCREIPPPTGGGGVRLGDPVDVEQRLRQLQQQQQPLPKPPPPPPVQRPPPMQHQPFQQHQQPPFQPQQQPPFQPQQQPPFQRQPFQQQQHAANRGILRPLFGRQPPPPPQPPPQQLPQPAAAGRPPPPSAFVTARRQLQIDAAKSGAGGGSFGGGGGCGGGGSGGGVGPAKRSLGPSRRTPTSSFVPPFSRAKAASPPPQQQPQAQQKQPQAEPELSEAAAMMLEDERLRGLDPKLVETILREVMDSAPSVGWDDIAGLEFAKATIKEIIVFPMLRPDIFTGIRGPPKGLLLFGPPGTGKSLIGRCIASVSGATFFNISASSLTSKWVGEGEKLVRALFAVARCRAPSVVFIDEVDSLLSARSESEHESSRRMKTEFLVQLDGIGTESEERLLVIGATNRPQELDDAARRRFVKRLYIPLPEAVGRRQIVERMLAGQSHCLAEPDIQRIVDATDGYSGADVANLVREAALGPVRSIPLDRICSISVSAVRPIGPQDFEEALTQARASVLPSDLVQYSNWNQSYGSYRRMV